MSDNPLNYGVDPTNPLNMDPINRLALGPLYAPRDPAAPLSAGGAPIPVRPATESVPDVIDSNFTYGRNVGPATVPIDSLTGGVRMSNPKEVARVSDLANQISGPNGYISRPIVDTEGNVVEGQHRIEALRQLGVNDVPVHVVQDLAAGVDVGALHAAVTGAQRMHPDQVQQLTRMALESVADEGSPSAVRDAYDPPVGHEKAWNAVLDFLERTAGNGQAPQQ